MAARRPSLADQVSAQVRAWVLDGTLEPGRLYSVQQLADRLEVSRSPAREALLGLAESGLVEFQRNRGFRIRRPDVRDLAEIFALRLALEPAAARRATATATPDLVAELRRLLEEMTERAEAGDERSFAELDSELHGALLAASGNRRVLTLMAELRSLLRTRGPSTAGVSRSLADILAEHRPIVEAVAAGQPRRAEAAMRQHLVSTGRMLVAQTAADGGADEAWAVWDELVDEDS